jgi:hypothetical protein
MASRQGGDGSGSINWGAVAAIAGVIAAIAAVIGLLALFGVFNGSSKTPEVPNVPTVPTTPTVSTETETEAKPPPPREGPKKVWENEATFDEDNDYNIDQYPIEKGGVTGFEVREKSWTIVSPGKVAAWTGHGTPSLTDCVNILNSASEENGVKIERLGQWFCAETSTKLVARLRFDSLKPPANSVIEGGSYKFLVIVYKPGES